MNKNKIINFSIIGIIIGFIISLFSGYGWIILILSSFVLFLCLKRTHYYCADCGQFLGDRPNKCDRCGCNRFTTIDNGVGRTIRNR